MFKISVRFQDRVHVLTHGDGVLELGRGPRRDAERVILSDPYVSRNQLQIEQVGDEQIQVTNLSSSVTIAVVNGGKINPDESCALEIPFELQFGQTAVRIERPIDHLPGGESSSLPESPPTWDGAPTGAGGTNPADEGDSGPFSIRLPIRGLDRSSMLSRRERSFESMSQDDLLEWFEVLLSVQKSAAGSNAFYVEAADAIVDLIGLDRGIVLLRNDDGGWRTAADRGSKDAMRSPLSTTVLHFVHSRKRTFYENPASLEDAVSLHDIDAVVASPILSGNNEVLGVLYGVRRGGKMTQRQEISELEAKLVQLLAASVGTGLARAEHEAEAARVRVQFEAFFSEALVSQLQSNSDLLRPQQRTLSTLFCDVRGFTKLSESLDPQTLYDLMSDLTQELSECVMQQAGVIIDFYGDGLAAMWNAPGDQPDHVVLAATAAEQMQTALPSLNERWRGRLSHNVRLGIGLHTGTALVGNVGSQRRMKYGPRGNAVNLCSRLEGLTKALGVPILASEETARTLRAEDWPVRRLGQFSLVGVERPTDVFQVGEQSEEPDDEKAVAAIYEEALTAFEAGELERAQQRLESVAEPITDGPLRFLQQVISERLARPHGEHSSIIHVGQK